jgi:hypothetical protein
MVVKEKRGRRRYVLFTVDRSLTKDTLISALRNICSEPPYVILCAEGWAIVRCSPENRDASVKNMNGADPSSASVRTSGTLSSLYERYPALERLRPPKKM